MIRTRTLISAAVAACCLGLSLFVTGASAEVGVVNIVSYFPGKCLEIENSSLGNGANAQQWSCVGQPGARWRLVGIGGGEIKIVNNFSGKCLEVENSGLGNGNRVQQWDCLGQPGARWRTHPINGQPSNVFTIVNVFSGKCLEIENSSLDNGANAQQWDCVGQPGRIWRLVLNA